LLSVDADISHIELHWANYPHGFTNSLKQGPKLIKVIQCENKSEVSASLSNKDS